MFMASIYSTKQLGLSDNVLIPTMLLIQLIGMFGAFLFARISGRIGNIRSLILAIVVWILVIVSVLFVNGAAGFVVVACVVGVVMGGTQALARSTYSKMLPETRDHTSFFSFYDVMEKTATVGGTFSFGIIEALTGSMRYSVLAITVFFIIGLIFMLMLLRNQNRMQAGS
jgi:UMF1 family MFS transporter